jgi:uncharacterized protein
MRQILLLILLFVVGQWLVKALRRADARTAQRTGAPGSAHDASSGSRQAGASHAGHGGAVPPRQLAEPMIRCAECGVHAPKSDSVVVGSAAFCSSEHAQRYAARVAQAKGRDGR